MTREDCWPVCMFCQTRFTLAPGAEPTTCVSWRSPDGAHVERRVATPEQRARMRLETPPPPPRPKTPYGPNDPDPARKAPVPPPPPRPTDRPYAPWKAGEEIPAPTPFDAAALRAGKPATGQTSLF